MHTRARAGQGRQRAVATALVALVTMLPTSAASAFKEPKPPAHPPKTETLNLALGGDGNYSSTATGNLSGCQTPHCDAALMVLAVAQHPGLADGAVAGQRLGEQAGQLPATPRPVVIDRFEAQGCDQDLLASFVAPSSWGPEHNTQRSRHQGLEQRCRDQGLLGHGHI
jgi:hypothetical protein